MGACHILSVVVWGLPLEMCSELFLASCLTYIVSGIQSPWPDWIVLDRITSCWTVCYAKNSPA